MWFGGSRSPGRSSLSRTLLAAVALALAGVGAASYGAASAVPVAGTDCATFPRDNYWRADISDLPVHPRSRAWLSHMSTDRDLHPDFGPSYGDGPGYGIPVTVVDGDHPRVQVRFDYAAESDHVGYPFGDDTRIEGGRGSSGDKHAVIVNRTTCRLYETWNTRVVDGRWVAGSGATWKLASNKLRPDTWTSADAAGLPILPGLLRYREVKTRKVNHAIRFTTDVTSGHHIWPARHDAGSRESLDYPPMGARFRLRESWQPRGFGAGAKAVVTAMKSHGLVLADNGSPWYFQGERHGRWSDRLIADLKEIPATAFVAVDTSPLRVSRDSAAVR
jgi:hypothetical protein